MSNSFLVEGKTKIIEKTNDQNIIRIVTKDFLTGGDAAKKEEIKDIGIQKTKQTSNVFSMPVSYTHLTLPTTTIV